MSQHPHFPQIIATVETYLQALHTGDIEQLRQVFHPDCVLKSPGLRVPRDEWLERVANRPIPANENQPYASEIVSVEIIGGQAMVRANVPWFDKQYVDFLGLLREEGKWQIVNKTYVDTATT